MTHSFFLKTNHRLKLLADKRWCRRTNERQRGMEFGHVFRHSQGLRLFLCLIFFGDVVFARAKLQTTVISVFTRSSSQEPLFGLFAFASVNISSPRGCHCTSFVSRKGFSSSRVAYYPNSVSSFQLPLLLRSGDVHPNPGPPSGIVSFESRPWSSWFASILRQRSQYCQQS